MNDVLLVEWYSLGVLLVQSLPCVAKRTRVRHRVCEGGRKLVGVLSQVGGQGVEKLAWLATSKWGNNTKQPWPVQYRARMKWKWKQTYCRGFLL